MSGIVYSGAPGAAAQPTTSTGGGWGSLVFMLLIFFLMFYFLIMLPQRRREKEFKRMIESLRRGDTVITIGGIVGKVIDIRKDTVKIKTANATELEITKKSIASVLKPKEEKKEEQSEKEE